MSQSQSSCADGSNLFDHANALGYSEEEIRSLPHGLSLPRMW